DVRGGAGAGCPAGRSLGGGIVPVAVGKGDPQEAASHGYGGREAFSHFLATHAWQGAADDAVRRALINLEAVPAPAGEMDVVLAPGWPGIMLHEAVGHGLEGDFNRRKTSAFAGLLGQRGAPHAVPPLPHRTPPH